MRNQHLTADAPLTEAWITTHERVKTSLSDEGGTSSVRTTDNIKGFFIWHHSFSLLFVLVYPKAVTEGFPLRLSTYNYFLIIKVDEEEVISGNTGQGVTAAGAFSSLNGHKSLHAGSWEQTSGVKKKELWFTENSCREKKTAVLVQCSLIGFQHVKLSILEESTKVPKMQKQVELLTI